MVDLRVCLQSADKELEELRMERKAEGRVHESRLMEHMQRVGIQQHTLHQCPLQVQNSITEMSEWPGNKATGNMSMRLHIRACLLTAQIGELEQLLSSKVAEDERRTEELQNLQVTTCGHTAYKPDDTLTFHLVG